MVFLIKKKNRGNAFKCQSCDCTCHDSIKKLKEISQLLNFAQNWIDRGLYLLLSIDWGLVSCMNYKLGTKTAIKEFYPAWYGSKGCSLDSNFASLPNKWFYLDVVV